MIGLQPPCLSLLLLLRVRQSMREHPESLLVKHLGLEQGNSPVEGRGYCGLLEDGLTCCVRAMLAHDVHVVRCDLRLDGNCSPIETKELLIRRGEELLSFYASSETLLWGTTWLYHIVLPSGLSLDAFPDVFPGLSLLPSSPSRPVLEATPYGWLCLLREGEHPLTPNSICWQRQLLLIVPADRIEKVTRHFLEPLTQGWVRIERHLHKALHHARLQTEISRALGEATLSLHSRMTVAASTMDFANIYHESQELEQVSVALMTFLYQKAHAEMVLQSLCINLHDFNLALDEVKLTTPLYEKEKQRLMQCIEQLKSDLEYARVITESTYAFQEMQRGIENNRLQRAGLMLTTASALLAGFTIFNSFLDIWTLVLADSAWRLPPMGLRMALGALAGISLPMTAYLLIERRYQRLFLWGILSVISVLLAVLSTIWFNQ